MNITGQGQYSKQTSGLRNPGDFKDSKNFLNTQHKLIFIYPVLYSDKIKVPSSQSFEATLRDFLSVTFLSDIFVQNTFNMIGMANQIRPLWDENRQPIDPTSAMARGGNYQGVYTTGTNPQYPIGPEHTRDIQQKINQKTAVIQHLIKTDPKFSKLRPFIEIITMGNMIEVPVIVGTANYPVDTLTMMYVLIAAIGMNRKLTNETDLAAIFRELETLDEKKYWRLLNNLVKNPKEKIVLSDWFRGRAITGLHKISGWTRNVAPPISGFARNRADGLRQEQSPELNEQRQIFAPLLLNKTNLDQTKLYFKFVLNSALTNSQFGIDTATEKSRVAAASAKFTEDTNMIKDVTLANFSTLIAELGTALLFSTGNLVMTHNYTVSIVDLKSEIIDDAMMKAIRPILNSVLSGINASIRENTSDESRNKIKILKDLCKIDAFTGLDKAIELMPRYQVTGSDFTLETYRIFLQFFEDFVSTAETITGKLENEIEYLASAKTRSDITTELSNLKQIISVHVKEFFKPFKKDLDDNNDTGLVNIADKASMLAKWTGQNSMSIKTQTIPNFENGLTKIFYYMLLTQLQRSLCKFIVTADVDLETITNEVTAWPNYTLVLPVEIVLALHAATMGTSWEHILGGGRQGTAIVTKDSVTKDDLTGTIITQNKSKQLDKQTVSERSIIDVGDNYVKGIVKFISNRLGVPNLIVVDSKKGDMYYKLMNQTTVNKTKITTIDTFIQSKLNRQMTTQSNY